MNKKSDRRTGKLNKRNSILLATVSIASFLLLACGDLENTNRQHDAKMIQAGIWEWTAKNLDVFVFLNGDSIPEAKTDEDWKKAAIEGKPVWCYYNNDPANGKKYGKLYNWYAVNDPRGLCPEGWHVPSYDEWNRLIAFLGDDAGNNLKSIDGWKDNGNGSDSIGFSALPGGVRYHSGMFDDNRKYAHFWTSTEKDENDGGYGSLGAWHKFLSYKESSVGDFMSRGFRKGTGMSVRCIRRTLYDGYKLNPSEPPNDGIMFVDHEATGRSGHVGNAITECKNGDILAFYVNGSGTIWGGHGAAGWTEYKRSTDGGKTWGEPVVFEYSKKTWEENEQITEDVSFKSYFTAYVTSVITAPNGNLIAFMSRRLPVLPSEKQRKPVYLISYDDGYTWSEPRLVDEDASLEDVTLMHSDGGSFVYEGNIYAVFIGGGLSDYKEGKYSFYISKDNGETFKKINDDLFPGSTSGKHMSANVLINGKFIVYGFDPNNENLLPYVVSTDKGYTWSDVGYIYMEKRMRNAQVSEKTGDYYFMTGRSGNWGDDPRCLVLYTSKDGINWDRGVFLNKVQQCIDSYTANEVIGKYDPSTPNRLLIQSSIAYSGYRNNIRHWWIENVNDSK
jgi:uncharacterized protein (TIGR02145 family)